MNKIELAQTTKDPDVLDELSQDEYSVIRRCVADNPNTKPETLDVLSRDKSPYVRRGVAQNPNTTPKPLEENLIMQIENDIINSLTEKEKQIYGIK